MFMRVVAPPLGPGVDGRAARADRRCRAGRVARAIRVRTPNLREHWRAYLVIGAVNSALPFFLFAYAALSLPASYLAILNATVPLYAVLLAAIWLARAADPCEARRHRDRDRRRRARHRRRVRSRWTRDAWLAAGAVLGRNAVLRGRRRLASSCAGRRSRRTRSPRGARSSPAWCCFRQRRCCRRPVRYADGRSRALPGSRLLCSGVAYLLYLPPDPRHRSDAHRDAHVPAAGVRDRVGCAAPRRSDHAARCWRAPR